MAGGIMYARENTVSIKALITHHCVLLFYAIKRETDRGCLCIEGWGLRRNTYMDEYVLAS